MSTFSLRVNPTNPNHHLWKNNGTWYIHYVVHPTPFTKDRIRRSLGTKSLDEARQRRDAILGFTQPEFTPGCPGLAGFPALTWLHFEI